MGQSAVSLDDVIVTSELTHRPSKSPDYRTEVRAIKMLVTAMSEDPDRFWQRLADTALELCRAGTAGVSLLDIESGGEVFRPQAVVGVLSGSVPKTIPRDESPCGTAIDRNRPQLVRFPERFFSSLKFQQPIAEALIIPFQVQDRPAGTIWIAAHDDGCKFDREDERIGRTLASFAAAACQIRNAPGSAQPATEPIQPGQIRQELQHLTQDLDTRAADKTAELIAAESDIAAPENLYERTESSLSSKRLTEEAQARDLNGLLTVINGYAMLMKEDLNDPAKLQEDIEAISEAASLVKALINSRAVQRLS